MASWDTLNNLEIANFNGGMNNIKADHDIEDNQAASAYNVYNDDLQGVATRFGYTSQYKYYGATAGVSGTMIGTGDGIFVHYYGGNYVASYFTVSGGIIVASALLQFSGSFLYAAGQQIQFSLLQASGFGIGVSAYQTITAMNWTYSTAIYSSGIGRIRSFNMDEYIFFTDGNLIVRGEPDYYHNIGTLGGAEPSFCDFLDGTFSEIYGGYSYVPILPGDSRYNTFLPYIPTYWIDSTPSGVSGSKYEELNNWTPRFKQTFNGNGTTTAFQMRFTSLIPGINYVIVNDTTLTSGGATAGYTVNYASGIFNLTTAASTGIGNVEIITTHSYFDTTSVTMTNTLLTSATSITATTILVRDTIGTENLYNALVTANNTLVINGITYTSGAATSGFTIDYARGLITPTTSFATGDIVTTITTMPVYEGAYLNKCTLPCVYGIGENKNLFLAGNPKYPARLFWSTVDNPYYFPSTSYVDVDIQNEPIINMIGHSNSLLIFKERGIYSWNGTLPDVQITEILKGEGLIAPDSLQLVNGYPTFLSQRGVVQLQQAQIGYKLELISEQVNGIPGKREGIMTETYANRQKAVGYMDDKRYYLWINNKIWVYEYNLTQQGTQGVIYPWLPWGTFPNLSNFVSKDGDLYFAGQNASGSGGVFRFTTSSMTDDGVRFSSYWLSKDFHIGETYDWVKRFDYQYYHMRAYNNISTSVTTCVTYVQADGWVTATSTTTGVSGTLAYSYYMAESDSASVGSAVLQVNMTPVSGIEYVEYNKRLPIHYKGRSIQYSVSNITTGGGFSLMGTKIQFMPERKTIR